MKSTNYPEIDHPITLIVRDNEIVIGLPNGKEIASLSVCTMEKDEKQENGKFKYVPTKSFYLEFNPTKEAYDSGLKNCAAVFTEES